MVRVMVRCFPADLERRVIAPNAGKHGIAWMTALSVSIVPAPGPLINRGTPAAGPVGANRANGSAVARVADFNHSGNRYSSDQGGRVGGFAARILEQHRE